MNKKADMALLRRDRRDRLNRQAKGIRQNRSLKALSAYLHASVVMTHSTRDFRTRRSSHRDQASAFSSRGATPFPVTKKTSAPVRDGNGGDSAIHQVSAYELYAVDRFLGRQGLRGARPSSVHRRRIRLSGFDYLGEPTPYYTSRSSYSGIIDLAGF
jgi:hypothetical protein